MTIKAGPYTGWCTVPKDEAFDKDQAWKWVEDTLCASGDPGFLWYARVGLNHRP